MNLTNGSQVIYERNGIVIKLKVDRETFFPKM